VENRQYVWWSTTELAAAVHLDFREILWSAVSKWAVGEMRTASSSKDVTTHQETVCLSALGIPVLLVLPVKRKTIKRSANAICHYKEVVTVFVKSVRTSNVRTVTMCLSPCSLFPALAPSEPECRVDQDCPLKLSCIQESCQNLCQTRNPCRGNLVCSVEDSQIGKRIVACTCPAGFTVSGSDTCEKGIIATENHKLHVPY
jgi:hypothetical protein